MPLRIREARGITVIEVEGTIDINSSEIIETVGWLVNSGKLNILLSMENVDLVDYNGLSILAIAYKNIVNHKGKIRFLKVPLPVVELLKVVKLDNVFECYNDEESALDSFFSEGAASMHLRRKFKRLDIHLRVKYKIVGDQKNPKAFEGEVLNLSAAGIYIYSQYTFPINNILDLELHIPESGPLFEAQGRVVYIADKDVQPHSYPGMGVSFAHLTPEKEKVVIDFIDKNITHRADEL